MIMYYSNSFIEFVDNKNEILNFSIHKISYNLDNICIFSNVNITNMHISTINTNIVALVF